MSNRRYDDEDLEIPQIDGMENKKNLPIDAEYMGTLDELLKFMETIQKICKTGSLTNRLPVFFAKFYK